MSELAAWESVPVEDIRWDEAKVLAWYMEQGFTAEEVYATLLLRFSPDQIAVVTRDRPSIMQYPVDASFSSSS